MHFSHLYIRCMCARYLLLLIRQTDVHKYHKEAACQLTIHLRYCGKRRGKGQIFQRSPSYPACCHKTAALPTPERKGSNQNIDVTQPQALKKYNYLYLKSDTPTMSGSLHLRYRSLLAVDTFCFSTSDILENN